MRIISPTLNLKFFSHYLGHLKKLFDPNFTTYNLKQSNKDFAYFLTVIGSQFIHKHHGLKYTRSTGTYSDVPSPSFVKKTEIVTYTIHITHKKDKRRFVLR